MRNAEILPLLSGAQCEEANAFLQAALEGYYGLNALVTTGRLGSGLIPDVMRMRIRMLSQDLAKLADTIGPPAPFSTRRTDATP